MMQTSESLAIRRLVAGQTLLAKCAATFGGRSMDMAGDSALLAFEKTEPAFLAAQRFQTESNSLRTAKVESRPLSYRIGLAVGKGTFVGSQVYGQSVNLAARVQSLTTAGSIGVEETAWEEVKSIAAGAVVRHRVLFAKRDEPAIRFAEVSMPDGDAPNPAYAIDLSHNEPFIQLITNADRTNGQLGAEVTESLIWEFASFFTAYGWRFSVLTPEVAAIPSIAKSGFLLSNTDYLIRLRLVQFPNWLRISVLLSCRHDHRGLQSITREISDESQIVKVSIDLASLITNAIVHYETERARKGRNIGSFQLALAGRQLVSSFNRDSVAQGFDLLRKGLRLDPEYPHLLSALSRAHAIAWRYGWFGEASDHLERALAFAERAVRLAPNDPHARADLAFAKFWGNEALEATWHYEQSIAALPFHPEMAADAGMVFSYVGRSAEAAGILERSVANLPVDADYRLWSLGDVYFTMRDYKSAMTWLSRMNDPSQAHRLLAATSARLGLDTRSHVEAVLREQPDFSVDHWIDIQPMVNEDDRTDYREALLAAGLPP